MNFEKGRKSVLTSLTFGCSSYNVVSFNAFLKQFLHMSFETEVHQMFETNKKSK